MADDDLAIVGAYRPGARNRSRLRSRRGWLPQRGLAALRRDRRHARPLSGYGRDVAASAWIRGERPLTDELVPMPAAASVALRPHEAFVPALDRCRRRARRRCASSNSSRPTSATRTRAGPMPRRGGISGLVRERRRAVDRRRAAGARRHLDRGRDARARRAERQATARRDPSPVRLARHRPGRAGQPGRVGARAPARRDVRANAGARSRRGARAARQHRRRRRMRVCAIAR